jgi:hypothetical protein
MAMASLGTIAKSQNLDLCHRIAAYALHHDASGAANFILANLVGSI